MAVGGRRSGENALQPTGEPTDEGMFRRLWRGRLPLWDAFWTYYVLGQVLAYFIGIFIATASGPLFAEEHATILFGMIAPIPYQIFAGVGVWRSASGRGVLGMLARLIVFVQLIAMLFVFGGLSRLAIQGQLFADQEGSTLLRGDVGGGTNGLRSQHPALAGEEIEA